MLPHYWYRGGFYDQNPEPPLLIFVARDRFTPRAPSFRPFGIVPLIRNFIFRW